MYCIIYMTVDDALEVQVQTGERFEKRYISIQWGAISMTTETMGEIAGDGGDAETENNAYYYILYRNARGIKTMAHRSKTL